MRKTKQTRKPRKVAKKTRKARKFSRNHASKIGQDVHASLLEGKKPLTREGKAITEAFKNHPMAVSDVQFEEPEVISITMPKHRAASLAHDISDLLCWWQGFKAAVRLSNPDGVYTDMAQNGIEAAQDLNLMLKAKAK